VPEEGLFCLQDPGDSLTLIMNAQTDTNGLISVESRSRIDAWLEKFPAEQKQSAVLPALHILQEQNGGWVSRDLLDAVAAYLEMPRVLVYEVGTFYSMIELEPVGRNMVALCTNLSCMLCGAESLVEHVEGKLGIKLGETTTDGRITLKLEEECLAACSAGPMMTVNGHYHENLTVEKVDEILDALE
jgi:NADH-quinone oxidoreductase subunit E